MLKQTAFTLAGAMTVWFALPAVAIAPGFQQLQTCQRFTAIKYRVATNQVTPKIYKTTASGYYIDWRVSQNVAAGYCFVTNRNVTTQWKVERGPQPGQASLGPNEKIFYGLPGYGDVIVDRGAGIATGDKQYFTVRQVSNGATYQWYARCANHSDQVYDGSGKYVGYNQKLASVFPYVCEFSPIKPNPPVRPQPR